VVPAYAVRVGGRSFSLSPHRLLGTGVLVTAVALVESWRGCPYAPFPVVHAGLAIVVPLWCRAGPVGGLASDVRKHLQALAAPALAATAFIGGFVVLYCAVLVASGKAHDRDWNLAVAYQDVGRLTIAHYGEPVALVVAYALIGVWPMFGEELFYRGFLLRGLLDHAPARSAAVLASALFGLRHAAQLVYLAPAYPWVAGAAYFVWAFGMSLIWCWVYSLTRSLWLCMATHGCNIVLAPVVLALLVR
jgi:membrane protease YdiL (CAAX protease family)